MRSRLPCFRYDSSRSFARSRVVRHHGRSPYVMHTRCNASADQGKQKNKTFSSFDQLLQQKPIVLVDFYATWCGPCQMMSKVMSECSTVVKDVAFVKVDTEKYPSIATRFQVQALPTLVLFKNGTAVARVEGALSASQLRQWIMQHVSR
jgi:thioredoxin